MQNGVTIITNALLIRNNLKNHHKESRFICLNRLFFHMDKHYLFLKYALAYQMINADASWTQNKEGKCHQKIVQGNFKASR